MDAIYGVLESVLPFDFIEYDFMKNALIAVVLLCPIFAILRNNDC